MKPERILDALAGGSKSVLELADELLPHLHNRRSAESMVKMALATLDWHLKSKGDTKRIARIPTGPRSRGFRYRYAIVELPLSVWEGGE